MKYNTLERCKAWVHWVFMEDTNIGGKDPFYEDRLLMAQDIEKLLAIANAAEDIDLLALPRGKSVIALEKALSDVKMGGINL